MDAQKITIAQCECLPLDLSASINPREDLNGDKCALLKVEMATEKATFEGNILGKVEYKVNEYWVYMSKGTTQVRIKCPGTLPLFVNFKDYNIPQLEMGTTYLLRLEVPLEGEKNHVTQQNYEISETTIPSWLSDSFKENSYVGISFPNKNCYDAKNQALMVAALQYSIKNGGARLKSHILTEIHKNEGNSGTRQVSTILHMKSFAINILNESYNKNGEFFVECEFLKDEMSKNEITAQVSIFNKDSIFNDSYDINCILTSNIAGTLCKTTYVCHIENGKVLSDEIRVNGEIIFDKSFDYPNFEIGEKSKNILWDVMCLSKHGLGFSQFCMGAMFPYFAKKYSTKESYRIQKPDEVADECYIVSIDNDDMTQGVPVRWSGFNQNRILYKYTGKDKLHDFCINSENIYQYEKATGGPISIWIDKTNALYGAICNLAVVLKRDEANVTYDAKSRNVDEETESQDISYQVSKSFTLEDIVLFPHFSKLSSMNSDFSGILAFKQRSEKYSPDLPLDNISKKELYWKLHEFQKSNSKNLGFLKLDNSLAWIYKNYDKLQEGAASIEANDKFICNFGHLVTLCYLRMLLNPDCTHNIHEIYCVSKPIPSKHIDEFILIGFIEKNE